MNNSFKQNQQRETGSNGYLFCMFPGHHQVMYATIIKTETKL